MTKQKNRLKQFILILLSFLMIFSNVFVANATVNYDNEVAPLYVNISSHLEKIEISGIKAECKAKLYAKLFTTSVLSLMRLANIRLLE